MSILTLEGVSRFYKIEKSNFYALKDFSYSFPDRGLVSICGKSGSGKSTLLNLISLMDKPSEGIIKFNNENISYFKQKSIDSFRNKELGIIFQRYNLFEEESAIFNIIFPLLVSGYGKKKSVEKAYKLAKRLNISDEFLNKKSKDLSGGEKQRVAILRALINDPSIILADEPTGALDYNNSLLIMDLLKEISKERLVIMVSHNQELVERYSDEIIFLKDGKKENVIIKNNVDSSLKRNHKKSKVSSSFWPIIQGMKIFKRKINKNLISIISLTFGLLSSFLIIGFSMESGNATVNSSYRQVDYGVLNVSHQEKGNQTNGKITLIKETRPTKEEIQSLENEYPYLSYFPNISYFFPLDIEITYKDELLNNISYSPVLSFDMKLDNSLLIKGEYPKYFYQTFINKSAYELLKKRIKEPLNSTLKIKTIKELNYMTGDETKPVISDYFIYEEELTITGVVDDFSFLSTPKVYYSYLNNIDILNTTLFSNLSDYLEEDISYYDYLLNANNQDEITSFGYIAFYDDYQNYQIIDELVKERKDKIVFSSLGKERSKACIELVNACSVGMDIFLFTSILGTVLIIGIISFSSFSEDRRNIAIMFSLGANKDDVLSSYLYSNVLIAIISSLLSILLSILLERAANSLLFGIVGIKNLIKIPISSFLGIRYLFPILIVLILLIVIFLSTYLPISFSSKISLKEELKEE